MTVAIAIVYLVTRVCLASAILTGVSLDPTSVPSQWHSHPSALSVPRHPNHQYDNPATSSDLRRLSIKNLQTEQPRLSSTLDIRKQKSQRAPQRFPAEIHEDAWLSAKVPNVSPSPPPTTTETTTTTTTTTTKTLSGARSVRGYQRYVPRYQAAIGVPDGYLTDDLDASKSPYLGKAESVARYHHGPQDVTAAIKALDRFLSRTLNNDGYNSELHPPLSPILSLVLSRYGRYVPGTRNPRVYAYMAVNNIHNGQPFGKYKYECDEEAIYGAR